MRKFLLALAMLAVSLAGVTRAAAAFPNRPIHIVVPYVPGVGADIASRLLSEKLTSIWGVPVIVDNKPGASGAIGTNFVIHAAPDGYTVLITGESIYSVYLQPTPSYDPVKDITPVAQVISLPYALVARKDFPASSWAEFVAYARANPGKVTISTPGYGTPHHILTELLMRDVGLDLYQVPGTAGVVQDVIAGRLDLMFQPTSVVAPLLSTGLKALAAGGRERAVGLPMTPSFSELGVTALMNSDSVNGIFIANGAPADVVKVLAEGFRRAVEDPAVAAKLREAGFNTAFLDAEHYAPIVRATAKRWDDILRDVRDKQR
jgi:tripartite-type tricarboxylate transporter receptor subunit TctC